MVIKITYPVSAEEKGELQPLPCGFEWGVDTDINGEDISISFSPKTKIDSGLK